MASKVLFLFTLGLTCTTHGLAQELQDDTIVAVWPQSKVLRVGQEGRINFTITPGKTFRQIDVLAISPVGIPPGTIYTGEEAAGHVNDRYEDHFEELTNKYDIKVKSMSWGLSGGYGAKLTYRKPDGKLDALEGTFALTAVEPAKCELRNPDIIVVEDDIVNLDCSTRYTGTNVPVMRWMLDHVMQPGVYIEDAPVDPDDPKPTPGPEIPKNRLFRANLTAQPVHDGQLFKCDITFTNPEVMYSDNCETTFHVIFDVTTVTFKPDPTPNVGYYTTGDTLYCSALGNPEPTYKWRGRAGNGMDTLQPGPTLRLTDEMLGGVNNYSCYAENKVDGQGREISRSVLFYVTGSTNAASQMMWSAITFLSLLVLLKPVFF